MAKNKGRNLYLVIAIYDNPDMEDPRKDHTGVNLCGAFHTRKKAKNYIKNTVYNIVGEMFNTSDQKIIRAKGKEELDWNKEMFHIKKIKDVYPHDLIDIDKDTFEEA